MPIALNGDPVGALSATRPRNWTPTDITLLEAVAAEASLAIRLGRLLDENRERLWGGLRGVRGLVDLPAPARAGAYVAAVALLVVLGPGVGKAFIYFQF